ncbi:MAG: shikimate dehydrogenase [Anaerolineae bacterium]|nr:shikimate dehydrogenase [Anaerolineae bacterium]
MTTQTAPEQYPIVHKSVPTFYFVGVTTGQSSINKVFPRWVQALGRPEVVLEGIDCKLNDEPDNYRRAVAQMKYDPLSLGGLVTAHKINLLNAARDMFDYLDPFAQICGEVSSISKRGAELRGHAKDPITSGLSLDAIIDAGYFERTGGDILCYGAGGSAVAIALHLINKRSAGDRPKRFIVVNRSPGRLEHLKQMVDGQESDIEFEYIHNQDPVRNDEIMESMPAGTIVINATGMGKDTPGSPITDDGVFPEHGIAWELNYRGELDFWHQSMAQIGSRQLLVEDGWLYFLHGWTQVVAEVLDINLTPETFATLAELAKDLRPALVYRGAK